MRPCVVREWPSAALSRSPVQPSPPTCSVLVPSTAAALVASARGGLLHAGATAIPPVRVTDSVNGGSPGRARGGRGRESVPWTRAFPSLAYGPSGEPVSAHRTLRPRGGVRLPGTPGMPRRAWSASRNGSLRPSMARSSFPLPVRHRFPARKGSRAIANTFGKGIPAYSPGRGELPPCRAGGCSIQRVTRQRG